MAKNARLFGFLARSDSPRPLGSDWSGRGFFDYRGNVWEVRGGYTQVGERFNAEVGFVPRVGYRKPEIAVQFGPEPHSKKLPWVRRFTPHINFTDHYGFEGELQTRFWHIHFFEVFQQNGGRFGAQANVQADRPVGPFTVFAGRDGQRVTIPPGYYDWTEWAAHWASDPSAARLPVRAGQLGRVLRRRSHPAQHGARRADEGPLPVEPGLHQERRETALR